MLKVPEDDSKNPTFDNFVLLEGFPPKEITSYGRAIYELGLQNTVITQKIN